MITFEDIKNNEEIRTYITGADDVLKALGYTEHSFPHITKVSETARYILTELNYPARDAELVQIAAYMHDIGNLVNRIEHSQSSAVMAFFLLNKLGMAPDEISLVSAAIGNHDEGTGVPVNHLAAALILADKCDVRCSRVRNNDVSGFDIHDRVNYSVKKSDVKINDKKTEIMLTLTVDTKFGSIMDYFEIFLDRMILCRKAAGKLGMEFKLVINGQEII